MPEGVAKVSKVYRDENGVPTLGTPERIAGSIMDTFTIPLGAGSPPTIVTAPVISGTTTSGQTLTVTAGTYTGAPTSIRQWYADGVAIVGATNLTFVLTAAQVGKRITVRTISTSAFGSVTHTTAPTAVVV